MVLNLKLQPHIPPRVYSALAPIIRLDEGEGTGGDAVISSSIFEWQQEGEEVATVL